MVLKLEQEKFCLRVLVSQEEYFPKKSAIFLLFAQEILFVLKSIFELVVYFFNYFTDDRWYSSTWI